MGGAGVLWARWWGRVNFLFIGGVLVRFSDIILVIGWFLAGVVGVGWLKFWLSGCGGAYTGLAGPGLACILGPGAGCSLLFECSTFSGF